jgi:hypothetical protein
MATAALLAFTGAAFAGAKDKSSNTLVDVTGAGVINNTTVKTKSKSKDCTLSIQAKPIAGADGDIVICIADGDVVGFGGNSLIIAGEIKAGQLKVKAPLDEAAFLGLGCGDVEAISYNGNLRCYLDDPAYRAPVAGPGSWHNACTGSGMLVGTGGTTTLKENDTQPIIVGLCQGVATGLRISPPASTEWARQGQRTAVLP